MKKETTYQSSGVDIIRANQFVRAIKRDVASTQGAAVLKRPGAFGGLFALDKKKYKRPVLVSSTDGVGTKLLVAKAIGKHDTVGVDLVAMNVNDILCTGAKPLFFLDYIACGKLDPRILEEVVRGIAQGCRLSGCAIVGGETAEMPGMYREDDYDLAGFAVGVVEQDRILDGSRIKAGDQVIGLPSSGLHSNGFSLVRKVLSLREQKKMGKELLAPTKIYVREVLPLLERFRVNGIAHITGGAFYEKLTKILPWRTCFAIERGSWPVHKLFQIIQKKGKINDREMYRTFNMGLGLVLVIGRKDIAGVQSFLKAQKVRHYCIGEVVRHRSEKIIFKG